jgi:toxin ParE1/3/4
MQKYILSKEADQELEDILFYTKTQWGDKQLENYTAKIYGIFEKISENPNLGTPADYIFEGIRKIRVEKHLIIYIQKEEVTKILRVLHHSQDLQKVEFDQYI